MLFVLRELDFENMLPKQEGSLLWTKECINNLTTFNLSQTNPEISGYLIS